MSTNYGHRLVNMMLRWKRNRETLEDHNNCCVGVGRGTVWLEYG